MKKRGHDSNVMELWEFNTCVKKSEVQMITSFSSDLKTECLGTISADLFGFTRITDNQFLTGVDIGVLVVVGVFVLGLVIKLIMSGSLHFGSGRYLAFSWDVEESPYFKFMGALLLAIEIFLLSFIAYSGYRVLIDQGMTALIAFAQGIAPSIVGFLQSAWHFVAPTGIPKVNYEAAEFKALNFNRPLNSILKTNRVFLEDVEEAVYRDTFKETEELNKLIGAPDYSTKDEVLSAIKPTPDKKAEKKADNSETSSLLCSK